MPAHQNIVQLRQVLAHRFPELRSPPPGAFSTGISHLDQAFGQGLQPGEIAQLIAPWPSNGSALLLHDLLAEMQQTARCVALVDGKDCFEPSSSNELLLWVRCQDASQALKAVDLLVRDSNITLTILDLKLNPAEELRRVPNTTWYRLQRVVAEMNAALLVLTTHYLSGSSATAVRCNTRLTLENLTELSTTVLTGLAVESVYQKSYSRYAEA